MTKPDIIEIPCGDTWMDCPYYDPDCCDFGECVIEDAFWEDDYAYNEDDAPEYIPFKVS